MTEQELLLDCVRRLNAGGLAYMLTGSMASNASDASTAPCCRVSPERIRRPLCADTSSINSSIWRPPTDVYETDDKIVVRVEIAGMQSDDLLVNFDQGTLTIKGSRAEVPERRAFHQMEIHFGEFLTEVDIPIPIDLTKIEAAYQDGFLRVTLPKAVPKHIAINQE